MQQVIDYFSNVFSTEGLPPRWLCGHWTPFQGWFYILSDVGIWAAYFTIPFLLLTFARKRTDIKFPPVFWLFAAFIFACGITHLMDAIMFWWPAYRLTGLTYFATAVVSWCTVFVMISVIPQLLLFKSPVVLEKEIQERIRVEQALQESEALFRTIVEGVTDYSILSLTPQGHIATWNMGAERITGYRTDEIIGQHFSIFYPPDQVEQKFPEYELEMVAKEERFEDENWRIRQDGSRFWANVVITAMRDKTGKLIGYSKVTRDLTERKRAEDELKKMNDSLEQLVETRTQALQKSLKREQLGMVLINSIRSEMDLDTVMEKTITLLGQYTLADRCVFWLYDPATKQFKVPTSEYHSLDSPLIGYTRDLPFPSLPVLTSDPRNHDVVNHADVQQVAHLNEQERRLIQERNIKSLLSVPVLYKDELLGRLQIHAVMETRLWPDDIVDLVQQVSDQVAVAVYHAQVLQSLRASEARKSAIMESSLDAVVLMSDSGEVVEWNTSAERIFGYRREDTLGRQMADLIIPERYRTAHHQGLAHYIETGHGPVIGQIMELPALRANGEEFISELTITRVPSAEAMLFTGVIRDITERKQSEEALRESEQRFRMMADSSPVMIWLLDAHQQITYQNQAMTEFLGLRIQEACHDQSNSHNWENIVHPDDLPQIVEAVNRAVVTCSRYSVECRLRRADGIYRWTASIGVPRHTADHKLLGFVGSTVDIHDHKRLTEALENRVQERTAQLMATNRELESFSYSVSHDLRAPLRTIDGFSQAVLEMYEEHLDDRGRDYLNRIRLGSQQMAQLIDDMLQLSRLTRGELRQESGVNISRIAEEIAATLQREDPQRQGVTFSIAPNVLAKGDRRLLHAALQNLLGNAWKYTSRHESAHIEFGMLSEQSRPVYYIKDDGAGFNMKYADKLFGAFQRLHGNLEFPGTGVGLATVARIIHRHGGEVWAEAEVEKGATFYFTLQGTTETVEERNDAESSIGSYSPG